MKILWFTPQLPSLRSGAAVRQYNLIKHLCRTHQVTVLSLVQDVELCDINSLEGLGVEVISEQFQPSAPRTGWRNRITSWGQLLLDPQPLYTRTYPLGALKRCLLQYLESHTVDLIQCEHLSLTPIANSIPNLPWILTEHNVESLNQRRQGVHAKKFSHQLWSLVEAKKLEHWEKKWVRRSSVCIAVSETDARVLRRWSRSNPIVVVPNGVDAERYISPYVDSQRRGLIFFGNLEYAPNADAITYFCRDIWPDLRALHPDLTLTILGPRASSKVRALGAIDGIDYVGFVDDIRPYLWQAAICVVPLRSGGGTRLKILEALAAGCAVVSSSIGVEGLNLSSNQDIQIADSPSEFIEAIVALLKNPETRQRLAQIGRRAVVSHYDWSMIGPKLEEAYEMATHSNSRI